LKDFLSLLEFIKKEFTNDKVRIELFKPNVIFIDIDCLRDGIHDLTLVISEDGLEMATLKKDRTNADDGFLLYDERITDLSLAKKRLLDIKETGIYQNAI
jgi:hypothetical protein